MSQSLLLEMPDRSQSSDDGQAPRCSPRRAVLPAQCGSSLPPSTAGGSDAQSPSALVLPALYPARISASSSLLAATMNQKSSSGSPSIFLMGDDREHNLHFT